MKKLLAILVILLLAAPLFAGTDILNFMWFNNMIGAHYSDQWNSSSNAINDDNQAVDDAISTNNKGWYHFIDFFQCGMWGTIYEGDILTVNMDWYSNVQMGLPNLTSTCFEIKNVEQFMFNMGITEYYTLGLGAQEIVKFHFFNNGGTTYVDWQWQKTSIIFNNTIKIPGIMNVALNFSDGLEWDGWATQTKMTIMMLAGLNGSYDFGFSWSLSEEVIIVLALNNWKDKNPVANADGTGNVGTDSMLISNESEHDTWTSTPLFRTKLSVKQEVLGLAGVENVTLTIGFDHVLKINVPYAQAIESTIAMYEMPNTVINTETKAGATLGLYGISIGAYFILATQDTVNSSIGFDGDIGGYGVYSMVRPQGRGQAGVQLSVGYSRGFFGFGLTYTGQGNIRDYDFMRDNWSQLYGWADVLKINGGDLWDNYFGGYRWINSVDFTINFSW